MTAAEAPFNPAIDTRPWPEETAANDSQYRRQIAYLFSASRFYAAKLRDAGFAGPAQVGGLAAIAALPFTGKDEIRASVTAADPIGTILAAPLSQVIRVFSTSGTTGAPSYIPLTAADHAAWVGISARSYATAGLKAGDRIASTWNAGPFVAGLGLDAIHALHLCHVPLGSANSDPLIEAIGRLRIEAVALTPSYALHLSEKARERGVDLPASSVTRLIVAGEPGGGEPAMRARLESAWGARVTEAMGIGDIAATLWAECPEQKGMHFSGRGIVHFELIDPQTGSPRAIADGAEGELVYTHLAQQAAPVLRFRSRDHVRIWTGPCACGRMTPRMRCIGRTDDMLIVRGVNVFPTALRETVNEFAPAVSGVLLVRPLARGVRQDPPLPVVVESGEGARPDAGLADRIAARIRERLLVATDVRLVPYASLPRSSYKSPLIDWSGAPPGREGDPP
jgi:phenylacetate-CoA ligase